MTAAGSTVTLTAQFYGYPGGPLVGIDNLTIEVTDPDGDTVLGPTADGLVQSVAGSYSYAWSVPISASGGSYAVTWSGTYGANPALAEEIISVTAYSTGTWATPDDVLSLTGKTVEASAVLRAQMVVDMAVGRTYGAVDALPMIGRSRYWLKLAVAYQTAWMQAQPDLYSRQAVTDFNQDGAAATFDTDGQTLGPLAQMAIRRLPWKRSRTLTVAAPKRSQMLLPFNLESSDCQGQWRPL